MIEITKIAARLYMDRPPGNLYHYTSIAALLKIVPEQQLIATDARFLNDLSEMRLFSEHMDTATSMASRTRPIRFHVQLRQQLRKWLRNRISDLGHSVFVACFTPNGNLLSQWRSYGDPNKGVSIGFDPGRLQHAASAQGFNVGKCIYDNVEQSRIVVEVMTHIEREARKQYPTAGGEVDFAPIFDSAEVDLLKMAVLFKAKAFEEEQEWRLVSPVISDYVDSDIFFREGRSQIIPYLKFNLPTGSRRRVVLEHAFIGPTPHPGTAMVALNEFLAKHHSSPRSGIEYSRIPYRTS